MRPLVLFAIGSLVLLAGCSKPPKQLVVGYKQSAGSSILGEIVAQHIENKLGEPVGRQAGIQGGLIAHQALLAGEIDVAVEDTGTAYYSVFRLPANDDLDILNSRVQLEYQNLKLKWVAPLGITSAWTIVGSPENVTESKLSELQEGKKGYRLCSTMEFQDRMDGARKLDLVYHPKLTGAAKAVEIDKVAEQVVQKAADLGVVNSDDPIMEGDKVKVLGDDQKAFASYPLGIVAGEKSLLTYPKLEGVLKQLEGKVDLGTMRKLQARAKTPGKTAAIVAAEFLQQAGFK